jgi:hypothetical protein
VDLKEKLFRGESLQENRQLLLVFYGGIFAGLIE